MARIDADVKATAQAVTDDKSTPRHSTPDQDAPSPSRWTSRSFWLDQPIDVERSTLPMAFFCFMTGLSDGVSFSASYIWVAFQTGNTIQLAIAIARLWEPGQDHSFRIPDRQALTSVCAFNLGALLCRACARFGRHGPRTRAWLVASSVAMAALTLVAAGVLIGSGEIDVAPERGPGWTSARGFLALAFLSASLGLQGAVAARLGTPFATTVVITRRVMGEVRSVIQLSVCSVWIALMNNANLFARRRVASRDRQILGVFSIFLGGFVGRALLQAIGGAGTLGIAAGLRLVSAASWLLVASPAPKAAV